jgi:diaminopimelate epimerase
MAGAAVQSVPFEKWQALGNDYIVLEQRHLPFPLTPARVRLLCAPHTGVGADGVLVLEEPHERGYVARLRIFNPDGSEAELSGNGAREAILYLRRSGWVEHDTFSIETAAGEIRPRITGPTTCVVDMGRAKLRSADFPEGDDDGTGELEVNDRVLRFQHVSIGNPQCAIEVSEGLEELELGVIGPQIERHPYFPNRTNVSFWRRDGDAAITARIFERGVGETLSSGTGACGAAVAAHFVGAPASLSVELDGGELQVEISNEYDVRLTGWAEPLYAGELSTELLRRLEDLG